MRKSVFHAKISKIDKKEIEVQDSLIFNPIQLEDAEVLWNVDLNKRIKDIPL